MTNIPTDLLRTLVAVVDLRSFTKAAGSLGVTQPAVSAQIKRLQFLLGTDLFDRSAQGVGLTAQGEVVVSYARRLLSINDQIVDLGGAESRPDVVIRVGTPSDFVASALPGTLARFRTRWPDVRFIVRTDYFDQLMRDLRASDVDILIALSLSTPVDARHWRQQEVVWVRGENSVIDLKAPVPLVSYGEPSVYHRVAAQALRSVGLNWQDVFTGPSIASLSSAVAAGLGVMAVTRRRAEALGLPIWEDAPLPKLRDLFCGVYVRESGARNTYEQLADEIAKGLFSASGRAAGAAARLGGHRQASSAA